MSADEIQKARFDALHVAEFTKDEMQAEIYMHALQTLAEYDMLARDEQAEFDKRVKRDH